MHKIPVPRTFSADEPFPREHCRHILFTTVKWGDHAHTVALVPFAPSNNSGSPANQLVSSHSNARMPYVYIKRLDLFEAIHIYKLGTQPIAGTPSFHDHGAAMEPRSIVCKTLDSIIFDSMVISGKAGLCCFQFKRSLTCQHRG